MLLKDGYLTAHNAINLAPGYHHFSFFLEVGTGTTRIQDNLIIMKSNASSNLLVSPSNLTTSNSIFSSNGSIKTTATSISNITHVSCSSNLTVLGTFSNSGNASLSSNLIALGTISTTSNIGIGTTTPRYGLENSKTLPNIGLVLGASNKGRIDFSYNIDPTISAGACARIEATVDGKYGGHLDFQNRTIGSAKSMISRLFIKSSGLVEINNSNPQTQ
jgi:hypothetical protein